MIDAKAVGYSLKPDPVVDPVETIMLANEAGDHIVIGEICIESLPAREDAFPQK
jgi:hypothetical protein